MYTMSGWKQTTQLSGALRTSFNIAWDGAAGRQQEQPKAREVWKHPTLTKAHKVLTPEVVP
jgi:hypothetical protein